MLAVCWDGTEIRLLAAKVWSLRPLPLSLFAQHRCPLIAGLVHSSAPLPPAGLIQTPVLSKFHRKEPRRRFSFTPHHPGTFRVWLGWPRHGLGQMGPGEQPS